MFKNISVCVFILLTGSALGLDERSVKEKRCLKTLPNAFKKIDVNWAQSISTWHVTHGSKLEYYRLATDLEKIPISEIKEEDLYYDGCLQVLWETGKMPKVHGFHGKTSETTIQPVSDGVVKFNPSNYEVSGTAVVTLTDNKTFQFFYKCYDDGEATWTVLSTLKDLDKKTEKIIHEHAKSLGFNEKYFTELEYETCKGSSYGKDEL